MTSPPPIATRLAALIANTTEPWASLHGLAVLAVYEGVPMGHVYVIERYPDDNSGASSPHYVVVCHPRALGDLRLLLRPPSAPDCFTFSDTVIAEILAYYRLGADTRH